MDLMTANDLFQVESERNSPISRRKSVIILLCASLRCLNIWTMHPQFRLQTIQVIKSQTKSSWRNCKRIKISNLPQIPEVYNPQISASHLKANKIAFQHKKSSEFEKTPAKPCKCFIMQISYSWKWPVSSMHGWYWGKQRLFSSSQQDRFLMPQI